MSLMTSRSKIPSVSASSRMFYNHKLDSFSLSVAQTVQSLKPCFSHIASGPDTPAAHIPNPFQDATPTRGNAFESPQHLRELAVPEETKRFIRVLQNPYEGSLVYLIGTAHVSRASVDDVRLLIEAVKPDVVAVEVSVHRSTTALQNGGQPVEA